MRVGDGDGSRPRSSSCVPRIERSVHVSADQLLAVREPRNGTKRFAGQETGVGRLGPKVPQHHKAGLESHQQLRWAQSKEYKRINGHRQSKRNFQSNQSAAFVYCPASQTTPLPPSRPHRSARRQTFFFFFSPAPSANKTVTVVLVVARRRRVSADIVTLA